MFSDKFKKDLDPIQADPQLINRTRNAISQGTGTKMPSPLAKKVRIAHRRYAGIALAAGLVILITGGAVLLSQSNLFRNQADKDLSSPDTAAAAFADSAPEIASEEVAAATTQAAAAETTTDSSDDKTSITNDFRDPDILRFNNYESILNILKKSWANANNGYSFDGNYLEDGMWTGETTVAATTAAAAPDTATGNYAGDEKSYSTTNVQVEGVDEADILKNDGEYIYYLMNSTLYIVDVRDPSDMKLVGSLNGVSADFTEYFMDIFYASDTKTLSVISTGYYNGTPIYYEEESGTGTYGTTSTTDPVSAFIDFIMPEQDTSAKPGSDPYNYYTPTISYTKLETYDVSNPENPAKIRSFSQEGSYLSSRRVGDTVYLITTEYLYTYYGYGTDMEEVIPKTMTGDGTWDYVAPEDIYIVNPDYADSFIVVSAIDTRDAEHAAETEAVLGSGGTVYASEDTLYIAGTVWDDYIYSTYDDLYQTNGKDTSEDDVYKTKILSFSITDGTLKAKASGKVNGSLLNQYSMDEYDGYFRIATTSGGWWSSDTSNNVFVLNDALEPVSKLTDLAPGESIYSVRFSGDRIYMVTFEQVDPLFVIDASNPEKLEVLGTLKIPGYSNYMQMLGDNLILAVGNATRTEGESVIPTGLKIAIFDVTDPSKPVQKSYLIYGASYGYSEVQYNPKALLLDISRGLIGLPVSFDMPAGDFGSEYIDGFLLLSVNEEGKLSHKNIFKNYDAYQGYGSSRGVLIDDTIFLLATEGITSFSLTDYSELGSLSFTN